LPFGPGFRLRRNHAYGAFPPFGFNPITQGRRRPFRGKPHPVARTKAHQDTRLELEAKANTLLEKAA